MLFLYHRIYFNFIFFFFWFEKRGKSPGENLFGFIWIMWAITFGLYYWGDSCDEYTVHFM